MVVYRYSVNAVLEPIGIAFLEDILLGTWRGLRSGSQPECQISKDTWDDMHHIAEAATKESPKSQKEYIYIHMKLLQLKLKPIKKIIHLTR